MKRKIYIRDGRRFKPVEDYTGYFYNEDGTFSKEKQTNSIGRCCLQTTEYRLIVEINDDPEIMTWHNAEKYWKKCFNGRGRGPLVWELLKASMPKQIVNVPAIWSKEEYSSGTAYNLYTDNGGLDYSLKDNFSYVLGFLELPIE